MKKLGVFFVVLMCFVSIIGFGDSGASLVPLNSKIIDDLLRSNIKLDEFSYYLSTNFTLTIAEQNRNPGIEIRNGIITRSGDITSPNIKTFNAANSGKLMHTINNRELLVSFEETLMIFERNQQDFFQLKAILLPNNETFSIESTERPILLVPYNSNDKSDNKIVFHGNSSGIITPAVQQNNPVQHRVEHYVHWNTSHSGLNIPNRDILGSSSINKNSVISYVRFRNPSVNLWELDQLYNYYETEARIEGVNLDIAIAQMLRTTNFLSNNRITTHNYAGLEPVGRFNGSFLTPRAGVRAHIHHLKGYASRHLVNQNESPRRFVLEQNGYLGNIGTLDDRFFRIWAGNSAADYRNAINDILQGLYYFSASRNL